MSVTAGAPPSFMGQIVNTTADMIHVKALEGGHEAHIKRSNVLHKANRPAALGSVGTVRLKDDVWSFTPRVAPTY